MPRFFIPDSPVLDFGTGQVFFGKNANFKIPCDATSYPDPTNISILYNGVGIIEYDICVGPSCDQSSEKCRLTAFVTNKSFVDIPFLVPISNLGRISPKGFRLHSNVMDISISSD